MIKEVRSLLRTRFIIWESKADSPCNVPPDIRKTRGMVKIEYAIPKWWAE